MGLLTSKHLIALSLLAGCGLTSMADSFTIDGLQYQTLTDSTAQVKKYTTGSDVVIPPTVTNGEITYEVVSVAAYAFRSAYVNSISVAGSVKEIEQYAFSRCQAVTISLDEGVENVGFGAFSNCTKLTSVKLPESLKVIGNTSPSTGFAGSAFTSCTALSEIAIPGSVGTLPQLTFQDCRALEKVTLGEGITTIDERAFENCTSLKSISLPSTLTTMNRGAFMSSGIESIKIPGAVKEIPNSAFLWCHSLMSFEIEEGVEIVGRQSFADSGPITEVKVPNSVTHINTDAFQGNSTVQTIHIGSGAVAIGHSALAVWAPDVSNVPHWALTDIYVDAVNPPDYDYEEEHFDVLEPDLFFGESSFPAEKREEFFNSVKLHVPAESAQAYRDHYIWGQFAYINDLSAIGSIGTDEADAPVDIYTITGVKVGSATESTLNAGSLDSGIYIIRSAEKARKVIVR